MQSVKIYDLIGIGIGPFNLSLAALLSTHETGEYLFLEKEQEFRWHRELMFEDSYMQTSFLKDLVTPVDPTNPHSFMNYLVQKGRFYHFLNTERKTVHRQEFEDYCRWVCGRLGPLLQFKQSVQKISFRDGHFHIQVNDGSIYRARHICVGSGPVPHIPMHMRSMLNEEVLHAKTLNPEKVQLQEKRLLVVGGGQSGLEIFRNALKGKWGRPQEVHLISGRMNLRPLDEAAFTNEFFSPSYVRDFLPLQQELKDRIVEEQKLSSDGNTPSYLLDFYRELYLDRYYDKKFPPFSLRPARWLEKVLPREGAYRAFIHNKNYDCEEELQVDTIILATGFKTVVPTFMSDLYPYLKFDAKERPLLHADYSVQTTHIPSENKIFFMNASRHFHGIADPQTSLMAWRSAVIINHLLGKNYYSTTQEQELFCDFRPL